MDSKLGSRQPEHLRHNTDGAKLGCPILSANMETTEGFDDEHGMAFQLPELGPGNETQEVSATRFQVGVFSSLPCAILTFPNDL